MNNFDDVSSSVKSQMKQSQGIRTFHEPLIPSSFDNRRRRRRNETQEIELSSRQRYQPPGAPYSNVQPPIGRGVAVPPTMPTMVRRGQRSSMSPHHVVLNQGNPAEDLAWDVCSHGFCCIQCVRTQEIGIIENCGAFEEIVGPGVYCGYYPCTCIVERMSLRVQQLDITIETKTKDDVFLFITVSVQFRVLVEGAYDAYYSLTDTNNQIRTFVYDVIRSTLPRMDLDNVFTSKTMISDAVFTRLQSVMKNYGYEIVATLVARITPNELVKFSMNEINASKRLREAVPHRADAAKYLTVKQAEARAETLYLQGVGIAKQRSAIVQGLKSSMIEFSQERTARDAMDLLLVTQYFDTLAAVGAGQLIVRSAPSELLALQQGLPKQPSPPDLLSE